MALPLRDDRPEPEDVIPGTTTRPMDLALLLLAASHGPPRARARDQQADIAGGVLRRRVLDRIVARDPDPDPTALEAALAAIVDELGDPSGPTRGVCTTFLQEWEESRLSPDYWTWLLAEAVAQGEGGGRRRRGRREGSAGPDGPEVEPVA
jgi:hypothetical protein